MNEQTSEFQAQEPQVHRVAISLCQLCLDGKGEECHTPGCALFLHNSPGHPIYAEFYEIIVASEQDQKPAEGEWTQQDKRPCYLCGKPAYEHLWVDAKRGGRERGPCPKPALSEARKPAASAVECRACNRKDVNAEGFCPECVSEAQENAKALQPPASAVAQEWPTYWMIAESRTGKIHTYEGPYKHEPKFKLIEGFEFVECRIVPDTALASSRAREAEAQAELKAASEALRKLDQAVHSGYDFNADPDNLTILVGKQFELDEAANGDAPLPCESANLGDKSLSLPPPLTPDEKAQAASDTIVIGDIVRLNRDNDALRAQLEQAQAALKVKDDKLMMARLITTLGDGTNDADVTAIIDEALTLTLSRDALDAVTGPLVEALREFGNHAANCDWRVNWNGPERKCDCGFDAALARYHASK